MTIEDARHADATAADLDPFAGILVAEKVTLDGSTTCSCYTSGIFDLKTSAGIVAGEKVTISGANTIRKHAVGDELVAGVGTALETCVGADTISVFVGWGY